jgi:hypothetical protein
MNKNIIQIILKQTKNRRKKEIRKNLMEATNHPKTNRTKKHMKIIFVLCNKEKSKTHACIFEL